MKIRPVQELLRDAWSALERFPLVLASATVGTLAMIRFHSHSYSEQDDFYYLINLAMIAALGVTSFISLRLFAETHGWEPRRLNLWRLAVAAILAIYYLIMPDRFNGLDFNRYWLINLNLHLLTALAPFLFLKGLSNSFWQYNKALFLRIFFSFIYSNTIYLGLILAIAVTDYLFEFVKFDGKIYFHLWIAVVGIFNTWFFLSGVPKEIPKLEGRIDYPKGLRIFTQFVLIPLVMLYVFILYLYMAKIITTWTLPQGWLSSFVLGVSVFGIVTLLLVHPLRESEEFAWIRVYSRYFYLALYPLIILMAVAIGRRVMDYGMTEPRYFILVFTVWLLIVATRFTLRPRADIRFIPLTLFVLTAAATWGPWSAMSVSKWNQTARLKSILEKQGLLVNGKIKKAEKAIEDKANSEISDIVSYLEDNFGLKHLEKWALPDASVEWSKLSVQKFVTGELGLEYNGYYSGSIFDRGYHDTAAAAHFNFFVRQDQDMLMEVSGYDYFQNFDLYAEDQPIRKTFETPRGALTLSYNPSTGMVRAFDSHNEVTLATFSGAWLKETHKRFRKDGSLPREAMTFTAVQGNLRCRLQVTNINGTIPNDMDAEPVLDSLQGTLLFSFGPE